MESLDEQRRREPEETIPLDVHEYPDRMDARECRRYVEEAHDKGWDREEFIGGETFREAAPFVKHELDLSKASIPEGYTTDPRIISHYADIGAPFPPVVFDDQGYVIDGLHRLKASLEAGESTIRAYIPDGLEVTDLNIFAE